MTHQKDGGQVGQIISHYPDREHRAARLPNRILSGGQAKEQRKIFIHIKRSH